MSYSYTNNSSNSSSGNGIGGVVAIIAIILAIIGFFAVIGNNSSGSSGGYSGSSTRLDYDPTDYADDAYYYEDYDSSDYYEPDYDDGYSSSYSQESNVETWDCIDTTSYDKNPYNDNYCTSSYGREMYTTDSQAESLDPYYTAGTSGHPYYNSF